MSEPSHSQQGPEAESTSSATSRRESSASETPSPIGLAQAPLVELPTALRLQRLWPWLAASGLLIVMMVLALVFSSFARKASVPGDAGSYGGALNYVPPPSPPSYQAPPSLDSLSEALSSITRQSATLQSASQDGGGTMALPPPPPGKASPLHTVSNLAVDDLLTAQRRIALLRASLDEAAPELPSTASIASDLSVMNALMTTIERDLDAIQKRLSLPETPRASETPPTSSVPGTREEGSHHVSREGTPSSPPTLFGMILFAASDFPGKTALVWFAVGALTLAYLVCFLVLLFSTSKGTVDFAQDTIKTLTGFFIGLVTGILGITTGG